MALDRLLPVSTTPGAVTGDSYMDAVQEEVTGLWDRSTITLTTTSGATDTITATATPSLTGSLGGSMNFILKPAQTNTGAVTLNVNGGGAVAVVDATGTALVAGALRINGNYFLHYDSGISKYVIVNYVPAATATQGLVRLATVAALATPSTFDFFNGATPTAGSGTVTASGTVVLDDTYDAYEFVFSNMKPATDDVEAWLRIGTGGGPTYQTTNYQYTTHLTNDSGGNQQRQATAGAQIILAGNTTATNAIGNAAGETFTGRVLLHNPEAQATDRCHFEWNCSYNDAASSSMNGVRGSGAYTTATALTAVRFMFESGNITSGRATLYGWTKS